MACTVPGTLGKHRLTSHRDCTSNLNLGELIFMFCTAITLKMDYVVISTVMNHTFRELSNTIKETNTVLRKL